MIVKLGLQNSRQHMPMNFHGRTGADKLVEDFMKTCSDGDIALASKLGIMVADLESALKSNNYK